MEIWTSIFWLLFGIFVIMSVKKCCVPNCNKSRGDDIILHLFPNPDKDFDRFNTWRNAIGGHVTSLDPHTVFELRRVCHLHFEPRYHTRSKRLSPNAVPTLQLSGFSVGRRPLQDITIQASNDTETLRRHQLDSDLSNSASSSAPIAQHLESFVQPGTSAASTLMSTSALPIPSISSGVTFKKPAKHFSSEMTALGKKIKLLQKAKESTMVKLKKALKLTENRSFQMALKKFTTAATIFIMLQFREVGKKKLGRRFKEEEKMMALAMYKQGPRAYRWLRKFFVLPSPLTLTRMISRASIKPGVNEKLFAQLKKKADKMKKTDKLCVLLFDEVALKPHFDYNRRTDNISGFVNYDGNNINRKIADHALVFMVRGLHKNYKQPLAYCFCAGSTPRNELVALIKIIIRKLNSIGFTVIATVCDQGATNVSAVNYLVNETRAEQMRINKEHKHFSFTIDENEIIPLYDPPHLIKGIRNNLLNKDLKCFIKGQHKTGKWDHIFKLYEQNPAYEGIRLMPKLTENHVIPSKIAKMKVKCATQVFSRTVAANMGYLANQGILPDECRDTADILLFFDELFDSVNGSYNKSNKKMGKPLLGAVTPKSPHKKVWMEARPILKSMKYITKKNTASTVPSISHWLQTIENMDYMVQKLSEQYDLTSIWMRHFNQDPLENFFGCIRSHGYRNTSPTCAGFDTAFAALLINNLSNVQSPGSNCEEDSCTIYQSLRKIFFGKIETATPTVELDFNDCNIIFVDVNLKLKNPKLRAQLEYVTGYVLRKLKQNVFKCCDVCKKSFYSDRKEDSTLIVREYFKNKNCLTYPNTEMINSFSNMQDIVIYIIRKDPTRQNIKLYIRTIFSVIMDYKYIRCDTHKNDIINKLEDMTINIFLFSWCKDTNKLLNGSRSDFDENDKVQEMAVNYFKKRCKTNK